MSAVYVRQFPVDRKPEFLWAALVVGSLFVVSAIVLAPVLVSRGANPLSFTIYQTFSHLCHQLPDRSFHIVGQKFAVCSRCTGIYFGFAASVLLHPLSRPLRRTETPYRRWLFVAAVPLFVDVAVTLLGVWENTHWTRFITGALLGSVIVFYVLPGIMDLMLNRRWSSLSTEPPNPISGMTSSPEAVARAKSDYSAPHRRI